jgi:hypothetical protein
MAGGFLPPEPPGPEPDLGRGPRQPLSQQPRPPEQPWQSPGPDNQPAVTGFVLAVVAAGLLVVSVGLLAFISLALAIAAVIYARRGRAKVESGETTRHRGLAQAGFVTAIVTLVIAGLVTVLELVALVLYLTDAEFREDLEDELDDEFDSASLPPAVLLRLALPILRGIARLVA